MILGLMPTLLAAIAPSIAETSILSLDAPLLSLLISFGVPAVYPARVLEYADPFQVLDKYTQAGSLEMIVDRLGWKLDVVSYVACVGSIVNIWLVVIDLCYSTVLSWGCLNWFMPLVWVILPLAIHLVAVVPFALAFKRFGIRKSDQTAGGGEQHTRSEPRGKHMPEQSISRAEPILTVSTRGHSRTQPWWLVLSNCIAGLGAFLHLSLGMFIFSSLLSIPINDALSTVARFICSALVCQLIVVLKLARASRFIWRQT